VCAAVARREGLFADADARAAGVRARFDWTVLAEPYRALHRSVAEPVSAAAAA
jgi:hypothetical protein